MTKTFRLIAVATSLSATLAVAHDGVKDVDVLARMKAMEAIGLAAKELGDMARGFIPFDPNRAHIVRDNISLHAINMPILFAKFTTDPKSEAASTIWDNWDDFVIRSAELQKSASALNFSDAGALSLSMRGLGAACSGCHKLYRIKN
ncbi:c-type cytochrome [Pseudopelagicola sp. nBUS_19]|uniref:c-type cytochrome n=1 Tax=Pseudopelagicola sp. nBUS_19 TaxID=3395316 RepID=UPI003EC12AA3